MGIKNLSAQQSNKYLTSVLGLTIFVLGGTELLTVLDGTVVAIALPAMENYFNIAPIDASWIIITYILFFSGFLILSGRLGEVFNRKKIFLIGISIIVVASLYSGFTQNFYEIILARSVQAIGAAVAAPTAMTYVAALYQPGKVRTLAFSIYGAMMGLGSVLALTIGGLLASSSWRWVFWINVPIGLAIVLAAWKVLPVALPEESSALTKISGVSSYGKKDLDYWGFATAFLGFLSIALTIYLYSRLGRQHYYVFYSLGIAVVSLLLFIYSEARAQHPVFPGRLMLEKNRTIAVIVNTLSGGIMTCMAVFVARYLQEVVHYSPFASGLAVLPFAGGMGFAMLISPLAVQKISPRWIIVSAGVLLLIVLAIVDTYIHHYPGYFPLFFLAVGAIGFGVGLTLTSILLSIFADVSVHDIGAMSAIQKITMEIGGGICLALVTGIQNQAYNALVQSHWSPFNQDWILAESFAYVVYWIIGIILCAGFAILFMTYTPGQVSQGMNMKSAAESGIVAE